MSCRDLAVIAIVVALVALGACVRHTGPEGGQLRGVGAGWQTEPSVRSSKLTARGATVKIVAAPDPGCTHVAYVTGVARRPRPRPMGLSREQWEATLPWNEAENDARNLAGAHAVAEIVIDARETQERRGEYMGQLSFLTYALVHTRAFSCPTL